MPQHSTLIVDVAGGRPPYARTVKINGTAQPTAVMYDIDLGADRHGDGRHRGAVRLADGGAGEDAHRRHAAGARADVGTPARAARRRRNGSSSATIATQSGPFTFALERRRPASRSRCAARPPEPALRLELGRRRHRARRSPTPARAPQLDERGRGRHGPRVHGAKAGATEPASLDYYFFFDSPGSGSRRRCRRSRRSSKSTRHLVGRARRTRVADYQRALRRTSPTNTTITIVGDASFEGDRERSCEYNTMLAWRRATAVQAAIERAVPGQELPRSRSARSSSTRRRRPSPSRTRGRRYVGWTSARRAERPRPLAGDGRRSRRTRRPRTASVTVHRDAAPDADAAAPPKDPPVPEVSPPPSGSARVKVDGAHRRQPADRAAARPRGRHQHDDRAEAAGPDWAAPPARSMPARPDARRRHAGRAEQPGRRHHGDARARADRPVDGALDDAAHGRRRPRRHRRPRALRLDRRGRPDAGRQGPRRHVPRLVPQLLADARGGAAGRRRAQRRRGPRGRRSSTPRCRAAALAIPGGRRRAAVVQRRARHPVRRRVPAQPARRRLHRHAARRHRGRLVDRPARPRQDQARAAAEGPLQGDRAQPHQPRRRRRRHDADGERWDFRPVFDADARLHDRRRERRRD